MRAILLVFAMLVAACGGPHPSSAPAPGHRESASNEAAPVAPPAPAPPAPAPTVDDFGLEWAWSGPPLGPGSLVVAPASLVDPGGLTCRSAHAGTLETVECVETRSGIRRWGYDLRDRREGVRLVRDGETLYVARWDPRGFGAIVERVHLVTGERRWRRAIAGLVIPIAGLSASVIELAREDDRVVVRGWDAGGRWAVAIDAERGEVLGARVFGGVGRDPVGAEERLEPAPLAGEIAWQWDGPGVLSGQAPIEPPSEVTTPSGGRCRWRTERLGDRSDDSRAHLECLDASGARVWGFDDASAFSGMQLRELAVSGSVLYVLGLHRMASGASVTAYDLATGDERWVSGLRGVGPIVHSIYQAWGQLRIVDGRPVVFGWEMGGRYVEALDPSTGATVFHRMQ